MSQAPARLAGKSRIQFHQGEALIRTAGTYGLLFEVVMEAVQNGLDANATTITVIINKRKRTITVQDDGAGVTPAEFEAGLCSVCSSKKGEGKIGRFGIGLISPLGKCAEFTFTSHRKNSRDQYIQWTFETESVRQQDTDLTIPNQILKNVMFGKPEKSTRDVTLVDWSTQVLINGYTKDRHISNITSAEAVANGIVDRYGVIMRKLKAKVTVHIIDEDGKEDVKVAIPKLYSGKKLPEITLDTDGGKAVFRIYLTRKTDKGMKGKVSVGEMDDVFRFSFKEFARAVSSFISREVIDDLTSGVFEGEILTGGAKLHEDRKRFVENEALVGFCVAIEEWHTKHGKKHLSDVREMRTEERYQNLGLRSLQNLEDIFKSSPFARLFGEVLESFKRGTVGSGHLEPDDASVVGIQGDRSLSVRAGKSGGGNGSNSSGSTEKSEPEKDKPAHHPLSVIGPRGQQRTIVKNDSMGLQFAHYVMEGSDKLWELNTRQGILAFNVRHPTWVECESNDILLMQLQEVVALQALVHHTLPDEWKQMVGVAYGDFLNSMVPLLQSSPSFSVAARLKRGKSSK